MPSSVRASAGERRVAGEAGASRVRSRRTRRPDLHGALGAEADRIRVENEFEVVRAQPVVAEDDIRVAVRVELHERRLLVEAAVQPPRRRDAADLAQRAVRWSHGGGCPAAGARRHDLGPARHSIFGRQALSFDSTGLARPAVGPPGSGAPMLGRFVHV